MKRRRLVHAGLALCVVTTGVAAIVGVSGGGRVQAATEHLRESAGFRLARLVNSGSDRISVAGPEDLRSALGSAKPGDTLLLAPGTYAGLPAKNISLKFDKPITITSADPANPAVFTSFTLRNVQGLTFKNLELNATVQKFSFGVVNSSDVTFDHVHVHGSLDNDSSNDPSGLGFQRSARITVINSEFQQLNRALSVSVCQEIKISGNHLHDIRSDGIDMAQVSKVEISRNIFRNFRPVGSDHPDAIQFWTRNTTEPSRDVLISDNLIMKGEGAYTQGIFLTDQIKSNPYERITVTNNLILGTGYNALRIHNTTDLTVANNELVSFAGDNNTFLLIKGVDRVTATGNRATIVSILNATNVTDKGNVRTRFVKDSGRAALQKWLGPRPEIARMLAASGSTAAAAVSGTR